MLHIGHEDAQNNVFHMTLGPRHSELNKRSEGGKLKNLSFSDECQSSSQRVGAVTCANRDGYVSRSKRPL